MLFNCSQFPWLLIALRAVAVKYSSFHMKTWSWSLSTKIVGRDTKEEGINVRERCFDSVVKREGVYIVFEK
jgi:hypothetical protein